MSGICDWWDKAQYEYQLLTHEQLSSQADRPALSDQTNLSPATESSE
jgi:hypothetical protein